MNRGYTFGFRAFLCLVFASVIGASIIGVGIARATISTSSASSLTTFNQTIKASSAPLAVIGINLVSDSEKLASTSIAILGSAGFVMSTDLATLSTATSSGVALYRDNKSAGIQGQFDSQDVVVPLADVSSNGATTTLSLTGNGEVVPANNTGANAGNDYFIVVRTGASATNAHAFTINIYPGAIQWSSNTPAGSPAAVSTNSITIDTVAPTLDTSRTGPANGSTGVPVSTFVHLSFNENLDQSTLTNNNVTLTTGGNPVGIAVRPFPDGFDIVVSSAPTYATSSRFAKATTVGSSFFNINGSSQVFPQGNYLVPVAGDIVYSQLDTFPPDVGLITNATLTSGTFAINGFPAFRSLQITKFATPTATGVVSGGADVGTGDLLVANTSANPTGVKYAWHIVSTASTINNAGLRLDNAAAAPTFATTTYSRLMPSATTTINASTQLVATTTFSQGDLVFAKLSSGGDNLSTYAWHLVTTAETVNAPAGTGTTSVLRLDSAAAAPVFSASSVVAKITTSAQGATDTGVQNATALSFGDIQFSKVTANAANTGAYTFHIVSNPATGATSTSLRLDNSASNLTSSATYVATAGTGVKDAAGNALASSAVISFTTGATGSTNTTPPAVQNSQPQQGNQSSAPNAPVKLTFSVAMDGSGGANGVTNTAVVKLSTSVNGTPTTAVTATNTYDSSSNTVTVTPSANLSLSTDYVIQVTTAAKSSTGAPLPQEYRLYFKTGSAVDSTAPTILGVSPATGSSGVALAPVVTAGFSKDMNPSTISATTITLVKTSDNSAVTGNVSYSPTGRSANFVPTQTLLANTGYSFVVVGGASGVKSLSNVALASSATTTFTTTATADTTAPNVLFANADNFGVAVTFSEPMNTGGGPNAVDNISNYTLESPVGTSISLGGKTVLYDAGSKTARITGLSLQNGNTYKVTIATPVQDLAANTISTSGTPAGNLGFGTVQDSSTTGGQLGPGGGPAPDAGTQGMSPVRITPGVKSAGASSGYSVEFPVATSIPLGGSIVLTFPSGFDVTNVAAATAGTESFRNSDINGPAAGTVTIANVTPNVSAGTVTVVTGGAATGVNTFVSFDLKNIVNSTIPNSSGYTVDIKTRDTTGNNSAILETKTSASFFLGATGAITLQVQVFHDDNSNGTMNSGEEITGARVFLFSPAQGSLSTTTPATGIATFSSLSNGDYMLGIDPGSVGSYAVNSAPQPITLSTNATKKYALGASGSTITISGTVTGPNGTKVDVFAGGQSGFSKTTITLTGSAVAYSLPVQANTTYQVGVGPSIPSTFLAPGAPPPPPPTFSFMPPPNLTVAATTTSVIGKNFTLSATSKTITGTVLDSTGAGVNGAGVFARPVSDSTSGGASTGFGTGGQTATDGTFTLNVVPGVYLVGVFKPGMPSVDDKQISVPSSGSNTPTSLTFKMNAGTTLTITGSVKDDSGNAIPYAGVSARKVNSTSDTSLVGGGSQNFIGGQTDANGAYTLYVGAGTWIVEAFAPGFGRLGTKTVSVAAASLSGQDFSAQTLSLGTITGTATKASVAQQGVMVRAEGSAGVNMAATDANGLYTLKVPAGSYTVKCIFPGVGEGTPLTSIAVTANTTTSGNDCAVAAPITITVSLTDGTNPITNAFVDVRDSNGRGNGTSASVSSSTVAVYTITVPPGTYTVRASHPSFGPIGTTASVNTTRSITYTAGAGALFAVTGTVQANSAALSGAWVSLFGTPSGQTNPINVGTQSASDGIFSVSVPAGSYKIRADKPAYKSPAETTLTVTAAKAAGTLTLTTASRTITGTVTISGSGVSGAYVDANDGAGGFVVAQTDTTGAYSLAIDNGSWTIHAHSIGYEGTHAAVTVANNSPSGQDIALTAISGFTVNPERQETMTPSAGGLITNSDIGSNFQLNIPANALGTGSNAGTITTQSNTAIPTPANGAVLSKSAVSIAAVDSSGQPIKNLNDNVVIVVPYSDADIPNGGSEADLVLGVWNDATQQYDSLSTTVDTVNNTLTATVSHFSDFAPLLTNTPTVSSSSSGGSSSSSGGGGGGIIGGVTVPKTTSRPQIVYPDGRIVYLDEGATMTSTPAGALRVGTKVSGKFKVTLKSGAVGTDVKRLQQLLGVEATGKFGPLTRIAVEDFQLKYGIASKGKSGFGELGPKTRARLEQVFSAGEPESDSAPASYTIVAPDAPMFARALKVGSSGDDVRILQVILNGDPDTQVSASGDGATGHEGTVFGKATMKAVAKFQLKHGLAKKGDPNLGIVGPKTRAKLNEVLAAWLAAVKPAASTTVAPAVTATSTATSTVTQ